MGCLRRKVRHVSKPTTLAWTETRKQRREQIKADSRMPCGRRSRYSLAAISLRSVFAVWEVWISGVPRRRGLVLGQNSPSSPAHACLHPCSRVRASSRNNASIQFNLVEGNNPQSLLSIHPQVAQNFLISVHFLPSLLSLATWLRLRLQSRGRSALLLQLTEVLADQVLLATLRAPAPAYSTPLIAQFSDADNVKLSDLGASNLPRFPSNSAGIRSPHLPPIPRSLGRPYHPRFRLLPPPNCLPQYSFLVPSPTTRAQTVHVRAVRTEQ